MHHQDDGNIILVQKANIIDIFKKIADNNIGLNLANSFGKAETGRLEHGFKPCPNVFEQISLPGA